MQITEQLIERIARRVFNSMFAPALRQSNVQGGGTSTSVRYADEAGHASSADSVAWTGVTGKPSFATVATSGSYNDLSNKPSIPSVSGNVSGNTLTITINGTSYSLTNTWRPIGTGADDAAAGNHTHSYLPLSGGTLTNTQHSILTLHRKNNNYSPALQFSNTMDGVVGRFYMAGSGTSVGDGYDGTGTPRVYIASDDKEYALLHNGMSVFTTATKSNRYTTIENTGWIIQHINTNDLATIAYTVYNANSSNLGAVCGALLQNQTIQYWFYGGIWSSPKVTLYPNGNMGIGIGGSGQSAPAYKLHVAGTIYAEGSITERSDIRCKDVKTYDWSPTLDMIADAPIIRYSMKDDETHRMRVGSVAQYWQKMIPETVSQDNDGILSMAQGDICMVNIIALAREVRRLEEEIKQLRNGRN